MINLRIPAACLAIASGTALGLAIVAQGQVVRTFPGSVDCRIGVIPAANSILPPLPDGQPGCGDHDHIAGVNGCNKEAMYRAHLATGGEQDAAELSIQEALGDTDIIDNNFDIEIDPINNTISGSNTMLLASTVNGLTQFTFRLRTNNGTITNGYAISTVVINGVTVLPASAVTSVGTYGRRITLDRAYTNGERFTVKVNYSGTPRNVGLGSFTIGATALNGQPFAGSLAEPYYAASIWPVKDGENGQPGDNADKSTATISITASSAYRSVANGLLQSVTPIAGGKSKYTWRTNIPTATYLYCFATHAYNVYDSIYNYPLPGGGTAPMPFQINISPGSDTAGNRAIWSQSLQMLETLRPIFGLYPFVSEKYGIYQFTFGGGMEHQTMTGMGGSFSEGITVHELGHQWWGDDVTCRYWNDIWLNEGFATYTEALWYERKPGSSGLPALYSAMANRRPSNINNSTGTSVYCYDVSNPNPIFSGANSYSKGAWSLHQLRKIVGDAVFFQILANHRAAHTGSAATTQDFTNIASTTSGTSQQQFFDQCVFGQGVPNYAYGSQSVSINGVNYLKLHIRQQQAESLGANGKFVFPIDVRVNTPGASTYVINNNERQEHFVIPINAPATSIAIDENNWILNNGKTAEAYLAGPPKLLVASPALGSSLAASASPVTATLTFSDSIVSNSAHFTVSGPTGPISTIYSYNAGTNTVSLGLGSLTAPGSYTVTVSDAVTAGGIRLDGEISNPASPASLPSGDGLPNGNAVYTFTVTGCAADFNQDGIADFFDYLDFVDAFSANNSSADFNGDSVIDFFDYLDFVDSFSAGC